MMSSLPTARALSTTFFMSHGERNWPFLMLTGLPAFATAWMKSVWRHSIAGVCSTSTTAATSCIGVYSCTSVSTGTPICRFTSASTRSPSSMPGPRKLFADERLALSKLDLKMKLMPSFVVISLSLPATSSWSCSLSTTQGPAIRKKGRSGPMSKPQSFMGRARSEVLWEGRKPRQRGGTSEARRSRGFRPSHSDPGPQRSVEAARSRRRFLHADPLRMERTRRAHEADEQRMPVARRRGELGMRLAREEPRVVLQLDHLDQQVVHRLRRDHEAGVLELRAVAVVELVAVAMALADDLLAVQLARERAALEARFLRAEAHRAALVGRFVALLDVAGRRGPLGDQRDHGVRARAVVLGRVGAFEPADVTRVLDHGGVQAVADAEVRDALLARIARGLDLALEAALAESPWNEDRVHVAQHRLRALRLDLLGLDPPEVDA